MRVSGLGSEEGQVVDMASMAKDLTRVCVCRGLGVPESPVWKKYTLVKDSVSWFSYVLILLKLWFQTKNSIAIANIDTVRERILGTE